MVMDPELPTPSEDTLEDWLREAAHISPMPVAERLAPVPGRRPGAMLAGVLELERLLGEGGMGSVWAAYHHGLEQSVAVKFISPRLSAEDPAVLARFLREAELLAQLRNPHVVRVFGSGMSADGSPYIVMERLQGETLGRRIRRDGALPLANMVRVVLQVAEGLSDAHALGIIHRDIKPGNIFMVRSDDGPHAKLLDFGMGKQHTMSVTADTTTSNALLGTPHYMSPEQLLSPKSVDARSDLWSLGVVAYMALTGRQPFGGTTLAEVFIAIAQRKVEPPSGIVPGIGQAIDDWFTDALCREPDRRFRNADELARELREAAQRTPRNLVGLRQPVSLRTSIISALSCGLLVALASWVVLRQPEPARPNAPPLAAPPQTQMLPVAAGSFVMGCNAGGRCDTDEAPAHTVWLSAFEIDRTEVTVAEYTACVESGACNATGLTSSERCNWGRTARRRHPINCVSWQQASAYCIFAGKRLPTEAQWEKAARGEDQRSYPWGEETATCKLAILNDGASGCGHDSTWPVGSKLQPDLTATGPYGTVDMAGNVWEWVADWFAPDSYHHHAPREPTGAKTGSFRVIRGGGWLFGNPSTVRAANRDRMPPEEREPFVGFRCVSQPKK